MKSARIASAFLLLAAAALSSCSSNIADRGTASRFREATAESGAATTVQILPNGLAVFVIEDHAAPVATVRTYVRTGGMLEGKYLGVGISHLLEHLVSGGTTSKRTEKEYERLLDEMGGNSNAATSDSWTRYFIDTTGENVFLAIDVLSEWMFDAAITEEEFKREIGVINREIERGEDNPDRAIYELATQNIFKIHPSRVPVIGYRNRLNAVTREEVIEYYHERYSPNNMILAVVGDFDAAKVNARIAETFGKALTRPIPAWELPDEPEQVAPRTVVRESAKVSAARLRIDFRTVPLTHPDLYPLDVMSYILSNGASSRMVQKLVNDRQLARSIRTWSVTPSYDAGYFAVNAELEPEKLEEAKKAIIEELCLLTDELVSEAELKRAKVQKISEHVRGLQTVGDRADEIAFNYLGTYDPDFGERYTRNIQNVTAEEIREVARRYFRPEKLCVTALVPEGKAPAEMTATTGVESSAVREFRLDNGIRVLLRRNTSVPLVSMQAFFMAGVRAEDEKTAGLSSATAAMMRRGTTTRSQEEIARIVDDMGASLGTNSGSNTLYVTAEALKADFPRVFDVFADVILNPTFPEDEWAKLKPRRLFFIRSLADDPMSEASEFFRKQIYPRYPYGLQAMGTVASVEAMTREDLAAFHGRHVDPRNMTLAIYGDIEPAAAEAMVRKYFGGFRRKGEFQPTKLAAPEKINEPVTVVKKTNKEGAVVFVGYRGVSVENLEDRAKLAVLDAILSGYGYPGGWLHAELRGRGLVYEVHAFDVPGIDTGYFAIYARCQPEQAKTVTELILKHVKRMRDGEATADELKLAKDMILTSETLRNQTNGAQAMTAAIDVLYGLGFDFDARLLERVKTVTLDEVREVANRYLTIPVVAISTPDEKAVESLVEGK